MPILRRFRRVRIIVDMVRAREALGLQMEIIEVSIFVPCRGGRLGAASVWAEIVRCESLLFLRIVLSKIRAKHVTLSTFKL